jgi:hypothetical protein
VEVTPFTARFVETIGWIVPAFSEFNVKSQVVHGLVLPSGFIVYTLGYAALYIAGVLAAAVTLFARREFK